MRMVFRHHLLSYVPISSIRRSVSAPIVRYHAESI